MWSGSWGLCVLQPAARRGLFSLSCLFGRFRTGVCSSLPQSSPPIMLFMLSEHRSPAHQDREDVCEVFLIAGSAAVAVALFKPWAHLCSALFSTLTRPIHLQVLQMTLVTLLPKCIFSFHHLFSVLPLPNCYQITPLA